MKKIAVVCGAIVMLTSANMSWGEQRKKTTHVYDGAHGMKQMHDYNECAERLRSLNSRATEGQYVCHNISHQEVVHFNTDKTLILDFGSRKEQALRRLEDEIFQRAQERNGLAYVCVSGHTDSDASHLYNAQLSTKRARIVGAQLQQKLLATKVPLLAVGHGETRPVQSNRTEIGKSLNRRTEIQYIYSYLHNGPCPVSVYSNIEGLRPVAAAPAQDVAAEPAAAVGALSAVGLTAAGIVAVGVLAAFANENSDDDSSSGTSGSQ
jgi:outer membrane protein OmpA-like peptidoglycan-associated protein